MRVARPVRRRLTGLTPFVKDERAIPVFYPMRKTLFAEEGDADTPAKWRAVIVEGGANPPQGVRSTMWFVQPVLAWGVRAWRQARPERISFGVPGKSRAAKSSTTKGPKGLARKFDRRRC